MNYLSQNNLLLKPMSRRQALCRVANGFGMLGLSSLLAKELSPGSLAENSDLNSPAAPRSALLPAKAKHVIFLFMSGGPSHVDTFDPKPRLIRDQGKPLPFEKPKLQRTPVGTLFASPFQFKKYGAAGIEISELFPHVGGCIDDICVVRSMVGDNIEHNGACLQMNTGEVAFSRPSLGSWLVYGLGTENQSLPGFVVISPFQPAQGAPLWSSSFLPAAYQGTLVSDLAKPIANLVNPRLSTVQRRKQLDTLNQLNRLHQQQREEDSILNARIESFELAFRMQMKAPEAFDISNETPATKQLYGIDEGPTEIFGKQCLMARKLVERGVRMVQVYHTQTAKGGSCQLWDQHSGIKTLLPYNCLSVDKPIAGLIQDLKARGLFEQTLVLWGGEFGRTPTGQVGADGREHHPFGFTMWLAGGGIKGGMAYGSTDEFGWHSVEKRVHVHDLHATILHLMGIDHTKLTYRYSGRDFRLTDIYGNVVHDILA
jgi:hypothetical protein